MMPKPRTQIGDEFIEGRQCAICGTPGLKVVRLPGVPDHVGCSACGSAFVVEEGGERVMYGKIPAGYPLTRRFALRQWAWLEAVEHRANSERSAAAGVPEARPSVPVPPPSREPPPATPLPDWLAAPEVPEPQTPEETLPAEPPPVPSELPDWLSTAEEAAPEPPILPSPLRPGPSRLPPGAKPAIPEKAGPPPAPGSPPPTPRVEPRAPAAAGEPSSLADRVGEPPAGERYRVVVKGERVAFPSKVCAHCLRSPAPARLTVVGSWPADTPRKQRPVTFSLHLCEDCRRRASAHSEAERAARLQAHLISALVALGLLVGILAINLVDVRSDLLVGAFIITIILAIGYSIPAILLLGRVGRVPPPPDAVYVRSTLVIPPDSTGLEAAFEWRNRHYAELFYQANHEHVTGGITPIKDRTAAAPP